jgi:UDP:flavonoid glycosyltransferase YjiC (YdhE family)
LTDYFTILKKKKVPLGPWMALKSLTPPSKLLPIERWHRTHFFIIMEKGKLHIAMLPWLAMGHLIPFMELSKRIAQQGHKVSFLSTPRNLTRLPKLPPNLSHLIHLIQLPLPPTKNLPADAEASIDLPSDSLRPYLRIAYDGLQQQVSDFLQKATPDWIMIDYAPHWLPRVAAEFGIPCVFLSLFSGATLSFMGPPSALKDGPLSRKTPKEFTKVPEWIPFDSSIRYYGHEARQLFEPGVVPDESGVSEAYRFAKVIEDCKVVAVRSFTEYEAHWLNLLGKIYHRPVIPVGVFAPRPKQDMPLEITDWLNKQKQSSVVYAAFGSEAKLKSTQIQQIALGLKMSRLPFILALKDSNGLPEDFEEEIKDQGIICKGWAPQVNILAHPSVGGFLTHCGWNSIVEGLAFGVKLVLLPLMFDQGLISRDMAERGIGIEVERDDTDGSFMGQDIAKSLQLVMVEKKGEELRSKVHEYQKIFGDEELNERCLRRFLAYLSDKRNQ